MIASVDMGDAKMKPSVLDEISDYVACSKLTKSMITVEAETLNVRIALAKEESRKHMDALEQARKSLGPKIIAEIVSFFDNQDIIYLLSDKDCEITLDEYDPRNNLGYDMGDEDDRDTYQELVKPLENVPYPLYILTACPEGFRVRKKHTLSGEYGFQSRLDDLLREEGFERIILAHVGISGKYDPEIQDMGRFWAYIDNQLRNCLEGRKHGWGW